MTNGVFLRLPPYFGFGTGLEDDLASLPEPVAQGSDEGTGTMFNFNGIAQAATAAFGALMLTTVAIGAAVGPGVTPAAGGGTSTVAYAAAGSTEQANG
jgi:hypothetical protein